MFDLFVSGARTQTQPESAIKIDGHMYELVQMERLCFCRMVYSVYFCVSFHFLFFFFWLKHASILGARCKTVGTGGTLGVNFRAFTLDSQARIYEFAYIFFG